MKEHKKYTDIIRLGHKTTQGVLNVGDNITITEKIDGANASFILDVDELIGVSCYSRRLKLSLDNHLNGYYDWMLSNIVPQKEKLIPNFRYYGEWLVPHKVRYQEDKYKKFYLFSIWDEKKQEYLSDEIVKSEAVNLGLPTAEYFYEGEYISFEHLKSFIGRSNITLEPNTGEGIVVKNVNYKDRYGKQIFVKLVSDAFVEVQKQKRPKDPSKMNYIFSLVESVLTLARVEKILLKKVDDGLLDEEFAIEDMGKILKLISCDVFEDCMKEESDIFKNIELSTIKKGFRKVTPLIVKQILKNR